MGVEALVAGGVGLDDPRDAKDLVLGLGVARRLAHLPVDGAGPREHDDPDDDGEGDLDDGESPLLGHVPTIDKPSEKYLTRSVKKS
ncbi:hypothetical protein D3C87_1581090 [compost metagenome]